MEVHSLTNLSSVETVPESITKADIKELVEKEISEYSGNKKTVFETAAKALHMSVANLPSRLVFNKSLAEKLYKQLQRQTTVSSMSSQYVYVWLAAQGMQKLREVYGECAAREVVARKLHVFAPSSTRYKELDTRYQITSTDLHHHHSAVMELMDDIEEEGSEKSTSEIPKELNAAYEYYTALYMFQKSMDLPSKETNFPTTAKTSTVKVFKSAPSVVNTGKLSTATYSSVGGRGASTISNAQLNRSRSAVSNRSAASNRPAFGGSGSRRTLPETPRGSRGSDTPSPQAHRNPTVPVLVPTKLPVKIDTPKSILKKYPKQELLPSKLVRRPSDTGRGRSSKVGAIPEEGRSGRSVSIGRNGRNAISARGSRVPKRSSSSRRAGHDGSNRSHSEIPRAWEETNNK